VLKPKNQVEREIDGKQSPFTPQHANHRDLDDANLIKVILEAIVAGSSFLTHITFQSYSCSYWQ
jgi:hypothetical protein